MIALFWKELRALVPLGGIAALMMSGDLLYRPFTERLDESTWTHIGSYVLPGEAGSLGITMLVLAAIVAFGAFPREHDERTIELLYSLPIGRGSIFVAKVLAGLAVLLGAQLLLLGTDGLLSSFDHQSFDGGQWRLGLALELFALQAVVVVVAYAHALFASVLRLVGLIPYVVLLLFVAIIDDYVAPLAWVSPTELLSVRYDGRALVVPWVPIVLHLVVALGVLGLAYLAWMGPAERAGALLARIWRGPVGRIALGCGAAAGVGLAALVAFAILVSGLPPDEEGEDLATGGGSAVVERRTARYVFSLPESHVARARALIDVADALHADVQQRLGTDAGPVLVCDLTDTSREHLGIASWTHVRVGIVAEPDAVRLRRTFVHETVHAF